MTLYTDKNPDMGKVSFSKSRFIQHRRSYLCSVEFVKIGLTFIPLECDLTTCHFCMNPPYSLTIQPWKTQPRSTNKSTTTTIWKQAYIRAATMSRSQFRDVVYAPKWHRVYVHALLSRRSHMSGMYYVREYDVAYMCTHCGNVTVTCTQHCLPIDVMLRICACTVKRSHWSTPRSD